MFQENACQAAKFLQCVSGASNEFPLTMAIPGERKRAGLLSILYRVIQPVGFTQEIM